MHRYFKPTPKYKESNQNVSTVINGVNRGETQDEVVIPQAEDQTSNWEHLEADPGKREPISSFHPDLQDSVRRAYLLRGPTQPRKKEYTPIDFNGKPRAFVQSWFDLYPSWLEYSEHNNSVHCLPCYLFTNEYGYSRDSFAKKKGFQSYNKKDRLKTHVGDCGSMHSFAVNKCESLMNQKQSIEGSLWKQSEKEKADYLVRLNATLIAAKYLLRGGLAFRGHDESENSIYKGNFLELLEVFGLVNEEIGVVLKNAPKNNKLTSPDIQKELVNACAVETINKIVKEIGDSNFAVLVDESGDCSGKEQMAVVVRFVDEKGFVMERFIGIVHVQETTAISLKNALESLLCGYKLSMSKIRGQGYDGASNMRGRFGGLKALIQKDNPNAYYVHCFAHQLQLALIAVVREHAGVKWFFGVVTRVVNVIRSSNKRQDLLREHQATHVKHLIEGGFVETGRGMNQELSLVRAGDTRWGSHFRTLTSLIKLFSPVIEVLEELEVDGSSDKDGEAKTLLTVMQTFDFIFMLHLMVDVLGLTNDLSLALQRADQDILNALELVSISKDQLQEMRNGGWEEFVDKVVSSCKNANVNIPDMEAQYVKGNKSKRLAPIVSNLHHYKFDCFMNILDMQLKELNERFNVENTELLQCIACLSPCSSFEAFDSKLLLRMARMYPIEFSDVDDETLTNQFECYIRSVRKDDRFLNLKGLAGLCRTIVNTKKHTIFNWVYELLKLALILPVATASVERVFSGMNYVKNKLRNRMSDPWLNDCLVTYVEKEVFTTISNTTILKHFQAMSKRKVQVKLT